jgi:hypothetical protein
MLKYPRTVCRQVSTAGLGTVVFLIGWGVRGRGRVSFLRSI